MDDRTTYQVVKQGSHVAVGELKPLDSDFRPTGGESNTASTAPIRTTAPEQTVQRPTRAVG